MATTESNRFNSARHFTCNKSKALPDFLPPEVKTCLEFLTGVTSYPARKIPLEKYSDSELKSLIGRTLPVVDLHSRATQELINRLAINDSPSPSTEEASKLAKAEHTSEQLPCDACKQRLDCITSCGKLEAILPSLQRGKGRHENLTGFYPDTLQTKERIRRKDIFEKYKLWKEDFTENQWVTIEMYYGECMTEKEIAQKTGKARTTINGLLNRAKKTKEERDEKLRRETREQMKKNEESDKI